MEQKNNWKAWLYLAPVLILMAIFLIYPLINTFFISFMDGYNYIDGSFTGWSFNNFGRILGLVTNPTGFDSSGIPYYEYSVIEYALPNTVVIVIVTVPLSILIALLISVGLNSIKWFQKILQTIFFLPYVTNSIAIGMVFAVVFDDRGIINYIFNLDTKWIVGADRWTAMIPLCIYIVWGSLPFKILILLSGLQGIDKQYYQAAQIDATPKWKTLWKITVPLLSPQILYLMITSFIGAFKEYTAVVGLFNGPGTITGSYNMYTIVYFIYDAFKSNTLNIAAAAAVMLFIIILILTFVQMWASNKKVHY
ncbi:MAG: sugar ABC transporter permease [Bacilli bacterium]